MSVVHRGALSRLKPFRGVPEQALQQLEDAGHWQELEGNQPVAAHGDQAETAMLLVEGRMRVSVPESDRELGDLWPGSVIGENVLFGIDSARGYSASTVVPSRILHLRRDALRSMTGNPAVAALQRHVIEVTARRLQTADLDLRKVWRQEDQARYARTQARKQAQQASDQAPAAGGLFERLKALIGVSA